MKRIKRELFFSNRSIFYFVSLLFMITYYFAPIIWDDSYNVFTKCYNLSFYETVQLVLTEYHSWTSRVLINTVMYSIASISNKSLLVWTLFNGLALFCLMNSLSILFVSGHKNELNKFIACLVLLFPFRILSTAGWIATTATYLWPMASCFVAFVPIKKRIYSEEIKWWEYIVYTIALVYAANNEQILIVILFMYTTFGVYFILKNKIKVYFIFQYIIVLSSLIFTITTPGNKVRESKEVIKWFPDFKMLDTLSKIDIGYSTTMHYLVFGCQMFFIVICSLLTLVVWKKSGSLFIRVVSAIPTLIVVALGPLSNGTKNIFTNIGAIDSLVPRLGYASTFDGTFFGQFFVVSLVITVFCIFLVFVTENTIDLQYIFVFLVSGIISRVLMGFSPTVYVSSTRTFAVMFFSIIAIGTILYSRAVEKNIFSAKERKNLMIVMYFLAFLSVLNMWGSIV